MKCQVFNLKYQVFRKYVTIVFHTYLKQNLEMCASTELRMVIRVFVNPQLLCQAFMLISSSYKCTKILFKYSYRITKNNLKTFGNRDTTKIDISKMKKNKNKNKEEKQKALKGILIFKYRKTNTASIFILIMH